MPELELERKMDLKGELPFKPAIHSSAIIASTAIIGKNVYIGANTEISDYSIIRDGVKIGDNCKIHPHAVIGEDPQDLSFKGEASFIEIGNGNVIREFVTIHKAVGEGKKTIIGDNNMLMAYSHVGHNSKLGNNIILANSVQLAGHVRIHNNAVLGGLIAIHQGCTIGKFAMISGFAATNKDIPPFFMYAGTPAVGVNVNRIGLRRAGISTEAQNELMKAFKIIYKSKLALSTIIEKLEQELKALPELLELIDFLKDSKRGIRIVPGIHERWQN